ncbi:MAG TPA: Gfo/Idh/MocA family oxidoreductase [Rhodopila sp.]|jgi:predicted dehydrogenase|nr:Gfo/Idh/MocA family oxidoreductase [Rhodopila sp.]
MTRFAVIGLDHRHVYEMTEELIAAGMDCAGYWPETSDPRVLDGFRKRFPDLPAVGDRDALLEDRSIDAIVIGAIPRDRAALAATAMRNGKDVMSDKPGVTTLAQLADLERVVAETGRIFSICFSERFQVPAVGAALRLVAEGRIGQVVQTVNLAPHRLNRAIRPGWFFEPEAHGGILCDIGSHQIDQFLVFTGSEHTEVASSTTGSFGDLPAPGFENFGEIVLSSERARGYVRVDWFTPDGLATWGDGRLVVLGTEGTIELRKYIDVEGRPGTDHLFLVNNAGTRHLDCSGEKLTYFRAFAADVRDRSATAMPQGHVFTVCRLALQAQARARRVVLPGGLPRRGEVA